MTMVHGDRWATGGRPQLADDRSSYNRRVALQSYYVHDLDPTSLRYELHRDLAISYGRYLSVVSRSAGSKAPGKITSIWFERVFRKLPDGHWTYLSHRTVHGPIISPAGIDPTRVAWLSTVAEQARVPINPPGSNALPNTGGVEAGIPVELDPTVSRSPEAAEVVAFQAAIESALVKGDVTFLQNAIADDFSMVHDESWIRSGRPRNVANKNTVLRSAGNRFYRLGQDDHVLVEMHGEIAITYGHCLAYVHRNRTTESGAARISEWYERVYEKYRGRWELVSHRTLSSSTEERVSGNN